MAGVWEKYKHVKCGDFIKWWNKLRTKEKMEWHQEKDRIDLEIEQQLWDTESRRVINNK